MANESDQPIINLEEISTRSTTQSATVEESRIIKIRILEMYEAWANGREHPRSIPEFPEITPRTTGITQVSVLDPFFPYGYKVTPINAPAMPSASHPRAPLPRAAPLVITTAPTYTTLQKNIQRPNNDPQIITSSGPPLFT